MKAAFQAAGAVVSVTSRNESWIGTSMGSREEFGDMLRFMEEHAIRPLIDRIIR